MRSSKSVPFHVQIFSNALSSTPMSSTPARTRSPSLSPPQSKRQRLEPARPSTLAPTLPLRPLQPLQPSHLRIFTWNVNGITPFLQPSITTFFKAAVQKPRDSSVDSEQDEGKESGSAPVGRSHSLRACLERWHWPHVLCLQEVKIASKDLKTQRAVQLAVKAPLGSDLPDYRAFFNLPTDRQNARGFGGKLYGVCTIVREDVFEGEKDSNEAVMVEPVDWEREGRVLVLTMPKSKIRILNVYAVNGTENPYRDDAGNVVGTRHGYKRKFHRLLHGLIETWQREGWCVMLAGDLNIAQQQIDGFPGIRLGAAHVENRHDFHRKFVESVEKGGLSMKDSFRSLHGEERKYTYRSPNVKWGASCDRVDLILLSLKIGDALVAADILDAEAERGPSDHLPSFATIDRAILRDSSTKAGLE